MKVAFYKGSSGLIDKIIKWWQRGIYSHCEAVLAGPVNGYYEVASSNRGEGVRIVWKELPETDWDFIDIPADVKKVRKWFVDHRGAGYDYLGLLGFVFRPICFIGRKWFCSEAIGDSLGIEDAWRYDPNAFATMLKYKAS